MMRSAPRFAIGSPDELRFVPTREGINRELAYFNRRRFQPAAIGDRWHTDLSEDFRMLTQEGEFLEAARLRVAEHARRAPRSPRQFLEWFVELRCSGPGQGHPLFPWLAQEATESHMKWFLQQEAAGEAGFDDLVALTQIKLPARAKLEMARNYWDEMGQGNELGMHGKLLERLTAYYGITAPIDDTVWQSLELANTMIGLAANRRYVYQSIGALGIIEQTAPDRSAYVNAGLRRLGVPAKVRNYFALHATLDVRHSAAWNEEVIAPLVEDSPQAARDIAEGALMRLECGAACYERYAGEFGLQ